MAEIELSIDDEIKTLCFIMKSRLNVIRARYEAGKVKSEGPVIEQLREIENDLLELLVTPKDSN